MRPPATPGASCLNDGWLRAGLPSYPVGPFLPWSKLFSTESANALSQLSGKAATGAPRAAFAMGDQFLAQMLDPFVGGRNGNGVIAAPAGTPRISFASEEEPEPALPFDTAQQFKAPTAASFEKRWSSWVAASAAMAALPATL
jgi:hypothetical protein